MLKLTTSTIFALFIFSSLIIGDYINIDTDTGNTDGYQYSVVSVHIVNSAGSVDGVRAIFPYIPKIRNVGELDVSKQTGSSVFAVINLPKPSIPTELHTFAPIHTDNYELPDELKLLIRRIMETLSTNIQLNEDYESIDRWSITPYDDEPSGI